MHAPQVKSSPRHEAKHRWFETFGSQCGDCGAELTMGCWPVGRVLHDRDGEPHATAAPGYSWANACLDGVVRCTICTRAWAVGRQ